MSISKIISLIFLCSLSLSSHAGGPKVKAHHVSFLKIQDDKQFPLAISARGVKHVQKVKELNMFPRGSAVLTHAGKLADSGIKYIIHAAPGSMSMGGPDFEPTVSGLILSVKNTIHLARKMNLECVAMPFIGGGIFQSSMGLSKEDLARIIIKTSLKAKGKVHVSFIPYGDEDTAIFKKVLDEEGKKGFLGLKRKVPSRFSVNPGSVLDFNVHGCKTIVNAANMELQFGGGLSGRIAAASGKAREIDAAADKLKIEYYK